MPIKSKKITDSAKGEKCTANIVSWCNYDPETVVYAHFPDGSGGSNKLCGELSGGYCCSTCHDVLDGRRRNCLTREDREYYMRRSQSRTLVRLIDKGILVVKGAGQ